ncbi:MAG: alcohol dehydrogenase catalytic domain-containing protein, partial [Deltaproteobacteria bacterium]|nr:alcohol dehydrogenase catalytic domain-containing protein [Deltaproteobacteria bacterium]
MKALCYTRPLTIGELKTELTMQELPTPEPTETQLLVRMKASSINIDDIHVAEGTFFGGLSSSSASAEKPSIPGVDVCGTVTKVGAKVTGFAAGDDVVGILMPKPGRGTWAQYCCVEARLAIPKP